MATPNKGTANPAPKDDAFGTVDISKQLEDNSNIYPLLMEAVEGEEGGFLDSSFADVATDEDAENRDSYYKSTGEDRSETYKQWASDAIKYEVMSRNPERLPASEEVSPSVSDYFNSFGQGISDYFQKARNAWDTLGKDEKRVVNKIKSQEGKTLYELGRSHGIPILGGLAGAAAVGLGLVPGAVATALGIAGYAAHSYITAKSTPKEELKTYQSVVGQIAGINPPLADNDNLTTDEQTALLWFHEMADLTVFAGAGKALKYATRPIKRIFTKEQALESAKREYANNLTTGMSKDAESYSDMVEQTFDSLNKEQRDLVARINQASGLSELKNMDENLALQKSLKSFFNKYDPVKNTTEEITDDLNRLYEQDAFVSDYMKSMPVEDTLQEGLKAPKVEANYIGRAGRAIDKFRKSGSTAERIKYLERYTQNLARGMPESGTVKRADFGTPEDFVKDVAKTPSEVGLTKGTKAATPTIFQARDKFDIVDEMIKSVEQGGKGTLEYQTLQRTQKMQEAFTSRWLARQGKGLQEATSFKTNEKLIREIQERATNLADDIKKGIGNVPKKRAKLKLEKEKLEQIKDTVGNKIDSLGDQGITLLNIARKNNLMSGAALKSAVTGSAATGVLELVDLSLRKGLSPRYLLKGLFHSLYGGTDQAVKSWLTPKGWHRRMLDVTGRRQYKGHGVDELTTQLGKTGQLAHAATSLDLQLMKEADYVLTGLVDHISSTTAMRDVIIEMADAGMSTSKIKALMTEAVVKGDAPSEFMVKFINRRQLLTDRILYRAPVKSRGTLLSAFGEMIYKGGKWFGTGGKLQRFAGGLLAPVSTAAANLLDFVDRTSFLGAIRLGLPTMTQRQVRGTIYGIGAYLAAKEHDVLTFQADKDSTRKFYGFGGKLGFNLGGKQYSYSDFGGLGDYVGLMAATFESINYHGNDYTTNGQIIADTKTTSFLSLMMDFTSQLAEDTYLSMGLLKMLAMMNAPESMRPRNVAMLKKELTSYIPMGGLAKRLRVAEAGQRTSEDFLESFESLLAQSKDVLIDEPVRDGFGTSKTAGNFDEESVRADMDSFDWTLFWNPNKEKENLKGIEVRRKLIDLGMFKGTNAVVLGDLTISQALFDGHLDYLKTPVLTRPNKTGRMLNKKMGGGTTSLNPKQYNMKLGALSLDPTYTKSRLESFRQHIESITPDSMEDMRVLEVAKHRLEWAEAFHKPENYREMVRPYWPRYNPNEHRTIDVVHKLAHGDFRELGGYARSKLEYARDVLVAVREKNAILYNNLSREDAIKYAEDYARSLLIKEFYDNVAKEAGEVLIQLEPGLIDENLDIIRENRRS